MRLVLHREIPEDPSLRDQWNALVRQMEHPEVFYTHEWALAVGRAYRDSIEPMLFLGYEGDSLAGLVVLATDKSRQRAFFLAATTADYCDFVCRSERRAELVGTVFAELRKANLPLVVLANLPADSATSAALSAVAGKHGYSIFSRPGYECAQIVLGSPQQREIIKQSVERKQVRYNVKAMEKKSPVTLSHLRSWDEIGGALPDFIKAHVARFLATGRVSNLTSPERRLFLSELARLLSEQGWMMHSRLMVGDQPVAWNYGFQFAGSWFWYQPTFDSCLQQYSPGFCLLSKIVEEACDTPGIRMVDLGLGAEGYKERLATGTRRTLHATATASRVVLIKEAVRYHSAAAIKSSPRVERWTRLALNCVSSLRKHFRDNGALGFLRWLWSRAREAFWAQREVVFFEATEGEGASVEHEALDSLTLHAIDLELLAVAAMNYWDDPETMAYLLRAAARLNSSEEKGFGLVNGDRFPVHFCWVSDFQDFHMAELDHTLKAPSQDSVLLFDCWTPKSVRGHGYYDVAISRVASQLRAAGKVAWIFSATTDTASVCGVKRSSFTQKFSLIRKRGLIVSKVVQSESLVSRPSRMKASSAA